MNDPSPEGTTEPQAASAVPPGLIGIYLGFPGNQLPGYSRLSFQDKKRILFSHTLSLRCGVKSRVNLRVRAQICDECFHSPNPGFDPKNHRAGR